MVLGFALVAAIAAVATADVGDANPAHIIAWKHIDYEKALVLGEKIEVTVTVYNVGGSDATDVAVTDSWPATTTTVVEGSTDAKFATISAGQNVSYKYSVVVSSGIVSAEGAVVEFTTLSTAKTVVSNSILPAEALSAEAHRKATKSFLPHLLQTAVLFAVTIGWPWYLAKTSVRHDPAYPTLPPRARSDPSCDAASVINPVHCNPFPAIRYLLSLCNHFRFSPPNCFAYVSYPHSTAARRSRLLPLARASNLFTYQSIDSVYVGLHMIALYLRPARRLVTHVVKSLRG